MQNSLHCQISLNIALTFEPIMQFSFWIKDVFKKKSKSVKAELRQFDLGVWAMKTVRQVRAGLRDQYKNYGTFVYTLVCQWNCRRHHSVGKIITILKRRQVYSYTRAKIKKAKTCLIFPKTRYPDDKDKLFFFRSDKAVS